MFRRIPGIITRLLLWILLVLPSLSEGAGKYDHLRMCNDSLKALAQIRDYTAIFHTQERLNNKLTREETINLKFRQPFSIYMKWTGHSNKGQEVLYIEGWNKNRLRVRPGGLVTSLITLNLVPRSKLAMEQNRHPVTEAGLHYLMKLITDNVKTGIARKEYTPVDHGNFTTLGRPVHRFEGVFNAKDRSTYYCHRAVIDMDMERKIPIRVQIFDWDNNMVENYGYENVVINPGLTDKDFDPRNKAYRF
jgi:hypothetical protein